MRRLATGVLVPCLGFFAQASVQGGIITTVAGELPSLFPPMLWWLWTHRSEMFLASPADSQGNIYAADPKQSNLPSQPQWQHPDCRGQRNRRPNR